MKGSNEGVERDEAMSPEQARVKAEKETEPRLFETCGKCKREIPKFASFEVYERHYNGECSEG